MPIEFSLDSKPSKMQVPLIALWLLIAAAVAQANAGSAKLSKGAHLLVSKQFKENYIVHGRNLTVTLHLHNVGPGYASTDFRIETRVLNS